MCIIYIYIRIPLEASKETFVCQFSVFELFRKQHLRATVSCGFFCFEFQASKTFIGAIRQLLAAIESVGDNWCFSACSLQMKLKFRLQIKWLNTPKQMRIFLIEKRMTTIVLIADTHLQNATNNRIGGIKIKTVSVLC